MVLGPGTAGQTAEEIAVSDEKTLKLVTNLKRDAIEKRLGDARSKAQKAGLSDVAKTLEGVEGAPKPKLEEKVRSAQKLLAGKADHAHILEVLDLVELNFPNLT
jgi:hypothetical protein